jgi:serine/threonine protein kinase
LPKDHFTFKRQRYEVIDRVVLGRREYLISSQLSAGDRRRFQAFDRLAGPYGALRILQFMPRTQESWTRIRLLHELSERNPELPQIVEFHQLKNEIVVIQPWIEGNDLQWWIQQMRRKQRQRIGTPEALRLFRGLAHAVHHLNSRANMVHADIKPANIIVTSETRKLQLIDYGSAWQVEDTVLRFEGDGKSQHYAAPEILAGLKRADFRSDQFSLAAVCFEVLTLELPYNGLGGSAAQFSKDNESESLYIPPSKLSPEFNKLQKSTWRAVDQLLGKALQLNPNDRFTDHQEWIAAWNDVASQSRNPPRLNSLNRWIIRCLDWFSRGNDR